MDDEKILYIVKKLNEKKVTLGRPKIFRSRVKARSYKNKMNKKAREAAIRKFTYVVSEGEWGPDNV